MMQHDLYMIGVWWLCFFAIGMVFFPFAGRVFGRFFDRGYLFGKTLGLAVTGYGVWLASSLKILPFTRPTVFGFLAVAAVVIFLGAKGYRDFVPLLNRTKKYILLEESMFFLAIVFWSLIRGLKPDIEGLEKFMDYGFVNSLLRTDYMPPPDMWFAGANINYYYFGHYLTAFLTKMSGLPSAVTYNLMISTIFAFTFSLTFALGANLIHLLDGRRFRNLLMAGVLSAVVVSLSGNLHAAIYGYILPAAKKMDLYHGTLKESYWYPDATRYIGYNPATKDKTIHEFPLYSFVVSDLHGHVLDIPFVLTVLAGVLVLVGRGDPKLADDLYGKYMLQESVLLGFAMAIFYMTNAWDVAIYMMVAGMALLYKNFLQCRLGIKCLLATVIQVMEIFVVFLLLSWPFRAHFASFAGRPLHVMAHSPIYQLLVLWGYQLFFVLIFLGFVIARWIRRKPPGQGDAFVIILCLAAVILLILPELVYVPDIYGPEYHRANTMFKLTYQAFMMLGLIVGYTAVRLLLIKKEPVYQHTLAVGLAIILALPLIYPFLAVNGYYGSFFEAVKTPKGTTWAFRYRGQDGLGFLEKDQYDDFKAVNWFNRTVESRPVILEANGDSYTRYGRISMATGLPTVLGWFVHEWLWRANPRNLRDCSAITARAAEVTVIYESPDVKATRALLEKYGIRYIVIGKLERDKFKQLKESKLLALGPVVFDSVTTKVIQVK
jgi:uncharacterized membrane protein